MSRIRSEDKKNALLQECASNVVSENKLKYPPNGDNVTQDNRKRNWTVVVYPESTPENWRDILEEYHFEWVESPLHDKDINGDGTPKKPHWHIALLFDGKKSYEQVKEIADKINSPSPVYVQSIKSLIRYFAHLDNPEKAQYKVSEIIAHGGADLAELLKPTASSRYEMIKEMVQYIKKNQINEFMDFMDYCSENHFDDWFPLMCDNSAFVIDKVIKSNRHRTPTPDKKADLKSLTDQALK